MLSTILSLAVTQGPAAIADAEAAYNSVKTFLATPEGQDLEAKLSKLFTHVVTPGAAVVVEPKAS